MRIHSVNSHDVNAIHGGSASCGNSNGDSSNGSAGAGSSHDMADGFKTGTIVGGVAGAVLGGVIGAPGGPDRYNLTCHSHSHATLKSRPPAYKNTRYAS